MSSSDTMYVATLRITSGVEAALVRIDLDKNIRAAYYQLTDPLGDIHEWVWSLTGDPDMKTFADMAESSIATYLSHLSQQNWLGSCGVVQSAHGLEGIDGLIRHVLFLNHTKPAVGEVVQ